MFFLISMKSPRPPTLRVKGIGGGDHDKPARNRDTGYLLLTPREAPKTRMKAWIGKGRGTAMPGLSTDEIMTMTRGEE
jgi:hypothetical protein